MVGAGGAGFPTSVKLKAEVGTFIVNGAECEPLLHKDKELLVHYREAFLRGFRAAVKLTGASRGVIGIKNKYGEVIQSLRRDLAEGEEVFPLSDTYPAGDEFMLVYDVIGKVIPPGGLPLAVGAAVSNVETLVNVGLESPVTHKFLTVAGAVKRPTTFRVPVGTPVREVLQAAGGATEEEFDVLSGGVMMGRRVECLDEPVTKTSGGFIVLPVDHPLAVRYRRTDPQVRRIGRSACDQCSFCTELCPRYLLGHPIEPHKAMRSLGFVVDRDPLVAGTLYCCECNLCSMVSCPEDLDPKQVCALAKPGVREKGMKWEGDPSTVRAHPLLSHRRVPTSRLKRKLGLKRFRDEGPLSDHRFSPSRLVLPFRQHVGAPAVPVVKVGQRVSSGSCVAKPAAGKLGAPIHVAMDGVVKEVSETQLVVETA